MNHFITTTMGTNRQGRQYRPSITVLITPAGPIHYREAVQDVILSLLSTVSLGL
jgi:hypothetical protein